MSRDLNGPSRPCAGPNRREWLRAGALGFLGLGMDDWFRLRAWAGAVPAPGRAGAIKPPEARSCIFIWLAGGPSHIDTWDPKPRAPADVRGEFKSIDTSVPGLSISEVFPKMARLMDRVALVRSMTSPESDHARATHHWLTGWRPSPSLEYPGFGSVVAKSREAARGAPASAVAPGLLPPYVIAPDPTISGMSGYLTPAYDPFTISGDPSRPGFRVRYLSPPDKTTLARMRHRREIVRALDEFARDVPSTPLTASRDRFSEQAYDLLTSTAAQAAFRIQDEPQPVREKYGMTPFGQTCLLARRLVEAGVSFVTINDHGTGPLGWDTHVQNFPTIKNTMAPPLDQGASALLEDLGERGLLASTLVVLMGEFGRTPKINPNAGRDHHGRAKSVVLFGAGTPAGLVLGRTDDQGDAPVDRPVTPADLAWVLFHKLGIDPDASPFSTPEGRPIRLVDAANPPRELIG